MGAGKEDGIGKAWVWEPRTCLPGPLSAVPRPHSCPTLDFALHHWSTSLEKAGTLHAVWLLPNPLNGAEHIVGASTVVEGLFLICESEACGLVEKTGDDVCKASSM